MHCAEEKVVIATPASTTWSLDQNGGSETETNRKLGNGPVVEKHYRSLLKAVSWRVTGTLDTILISFLITGKIKMAVSIGFVEVFTKIFLFYMHERIWTRIRLGRAQPPEDFAI